MDNRYTNIAIKKNESNRRVTRSVLYPPIPRMETDIYVMTTPGDRLDLLAYKYYSSTNYWWIIAEANAIGKGTFVLPPGQQIRIPRDILPILEDYRQLNS